jgi:hypothetical protein
MEKWARYGGCVFCGGDFAGGVPAKSGQEIGRGGVFD